MEHVSYLGVLFTMIFYAISVSPSLLPRRWWWHAFVSGTLMGIGYTTGWGLETAIGWAGRETGIQVVVPPDLASFLSTIIFVLVVAWTVRAVVHFYIDSRKAALMADMKPVSPLEYLLGFVSSFFLFGVVLQINYLLLTIFNIVVDVLSLWVYRPVASVVSLAGVALLVLLFLNKVVLKTGLAIFARRAGKLNTTTGGGFEQPALSERSGSPDSLSKWETIGGQGRKFLTLGPTAADISAVTGKPALQPIRVYAGMPRNDSALEPLADLVVDELKRTGGFERSVIVVNTTTGSGWVDEWLVQPVEYLTGGDCAVATMQYSYLFSAALMLTGLDPCAEAGKLLFEKIRDEVSKLPPNERPLIYVAGESLGSYGSQAAFRDLEEAGRQVAGAVWVGSPNGSPLWLEGTQGRGPGSPEVAPVFDQGHHVRFVNDPSQLEADLYGRKFEHWRFPRIAFVQHASDPVVWYSAPMIWREPDWLRERVGVDVSPSMSYTPVVTYLQVAADLPVAGGAPQGHGHTYHEELVDVWFYGLGCDEEEPPFADRGRACTAPTNVGPQLLEDIGVAIRNAMAAPPQEDAR